VLEVEEMELEVVVVTEGGGDKGWRRRGRG